MAAYVAWTALLLSGVLACSANGDPGSSGDLHLDNYDTWTSGQDVAPDSLARDHDVDVVAMDVNTGHEDGLRPAPDGLDPTVDTDVKSNRDANVIAPRDAASEVLAGDGLGPDRSDADDEPPSMPETEFRAPDLGSDAVPTDLDAPGPEEDAEGPTCGEIETALLSLFWEGSRCDVDADCSAELSVGASAQQGWGAGPELPCDYCCFTPLGVDADLDAIVALQWLWTFGGCGGKSCCLAVPGPPVCYEGQCTFGVGPICSAD